MDKTDVPDVVFKWFDLYLFDADARVFSAEDITQIIEWYKNEIRKGKINLSKEK